MIPSSCQDKNCRNMPRKTAYSVIWARKVVMELADKHPRATAWAQAIWGVTTNDLALFLARNDPFWQVFRRTWKTAQRQIDMGVVTRDVTTTIRGEMLDPKLYTKIFRFDSDTADRFIRRLTARPEVLL